MPAGTWSGASTASADSPLTELAEGPYLVRIANIEFVLILVDFWEALGTILAGKRPPKKSLKKASGTYRLEERKQDPGGFSPAISGKRLLLLLIILFLSLYLFLFFLWQSPSHSSSLSFNILHLLCCRLCGILISERVFVACKSKGNFWGKRARKNYKKREEKHRKGKPRQEFLLVVVGFLLGVCGLPAGGSVIYVLLYLLTYYLAMTV